MTNNTSSSPFSSGLLPYVSNSYSQLLVFCISFLCRQPPYDVLPSDCFTVSCTFQKETKKKKKKEKGQLVNCASQRRASYCKVVFWVLVCVTVVTDLVSAGSTTLSAPYPPSSSFPVPVLLTLIFLSPFLTY